MERQVGIGSAAGAIEPHIKARGHLWLDVTYSKPDGLLERMPVPRRLSGPLRGVLQTSAALRQGPFAGLFFLTHNPAIFQRRATVRTPTVLWTDVTPAQLNRQADTYGHPVDGVRALEALKTRVVRGTFKRAAACVGWSEWARRSFVDDYQVPEQKTHVIPPGIDLGRWRFQTKSAKEQMVRLLFVGGDFERKGGKLLLEVFREHLRGRCVVDVVTRDDVAEERGVRVHRGLSPTSPRLMELYREASIFVLPTLGDCYSMASLEAMATGLPVVVSRIGGIEDIIEQDGSGHLVTPGDGRELRDALEALIDDEGRQRQMGARGRSIVEARFDAEKTASAVVSLLDGLATES